MGNHLCSACTAQRDLVAGAWVVHGDRLGKVSNAYGDGSHVEVIYADDGTQSERLAAPGPGTPPQGAVVALASPAQVA